MNMTEVATGKRIRLITRQGLKRLAVLFGVIAIGLLYGWLSMIRMPGESFRGVLPAATDAERAMAAEMETHVRTLAGSMGQRSTFNARQLAEAGLYVKGKFEAAGYTVREHTYVLRGTTVPNLEVEIRGTETPDEIVVIGAHFDSFQGTPGADDNASGVAALLAWAAREAGHARARTVRFVAFVNEEPPAFQTADMGSWVYAKKCRESKDNIVAMLSLEAIGYYRDEEGSQHYPWPLGVFYPDRGDFVAMVGNWSSRELVRECVGTFRSATKFPCEGAAPPGLIPGVGWSDHWAFWQEGYPALMVTATAPFRNANYHQPSDTPDTLDYERMARVVEGLERVLDELAGQKSK
ncbi:MAG: M28 family peptidase [Phycisphaerales bacterium]